MKVSQKLVHTTLKLTVCLIALSLLPACSPQKSTTAVTTSNSNTVVLSGTKPLAYCNQTTTSSIAFNTAVYKDPSTQQYNSDVIKMKVSFLASTASASGNIVKFFKWKSNGEIDNNPLTFATYNYNNGLATSGALQSIAASSINHTTGIYIALNDPSFAYQVLKVVIYNTDGAVLASTNTLIPTFYASPVDYKLNADGSARPELIQQLHKLYGTDVTGKGPAELEQAFNQYCF